MSTTFDIADQPMVLIIDDDEHTRMIAAEYLSQHGFRSAEAFDGRTALAVLDKIQPDLILLDVEMPGVTGFDVCEIIRQKAAYQLTPILMLTGLADDETVDRAYDAGATDFASKPINWSLLARRLRYMYRTSKAAEQMIRDQGSLAAAQRIAQLGSWHHDYRSEVTNWSDQIYRMLAVRKGSVEPSHNAMIEFVAKDDEQRVRAWLLNIRSPDGATSIDHKIVLSNGMVRSVRQQVEREYDSSGIVIGVRATVQDFTERRAVENKVHQLAYFDTLTDLPNRALFQDRLASSMREAKENETNLAILYFDLDDFKRVNDTFGHGVGDKLLQAVGTRIANCLRGSQEGDEHFFKANTIARMGGDEFTVILKNIKRAEDAETVAQRIINSVSQPINLEGYEIYSSPSIGIALYPRDGEIAETLLKNADMAMYEAKRAGKGMYKMHDAQMDERALKQYNIDAQLRVALENDEFTINYQPQLDLSNGCIYSVEALLRWNNETLGFVSPADFIPVAEESGLIVPIGEWVLRNSCKQAKQWIDEGFAVQSVAVNVSALQFMRNDFSTTVSDILAETGLPAQNLELEITESLLASDIKHAVETLNELNQIGVQLSIDDFGTGYSSLSQLKNFPIDRLKIDQSFIFHVTENENDAAITRAVIAMASSMNIKVLAEGVETIDHLNFLRENNCDEVQGYYICKPQNASDLAEQMPELLRNMAEIFGDSYDQKKTG